MFDYEHGESQVIPCSHCACLLNAQQARILSSDDGVYQACCDVCFDLSTMLHPLAFENPLMANDKFAKRLFSMTFRQADMFQIAHRSHMVSQSQIIFSILRFKQTWRGIDVYSVVSEHHTIRFLNSISLELDRRLLNKPDFTRQLYGDDGYQHVKRSVRHMVGLHNRIQGKIRCAVAELGGE